MADKTANGKTLQDAVVVGGTPGSANGDVQAQTGTAVTIRAGANRQYISGGSRTWYTNQPRSLSHAFDDLTHDLGADLYARMILDPQVRSIINVLKTAILEDGISLMPAVDKDEDGYDAAKEFADDATEMFENLEPAFDDTLWNLLDAVFMGHRMAEQVYTLDTTYSGRSQYLLTTLAVKPIASTAFVVDAYLSVLGILGQIPGQPMPVQQGMLFTDIKNTDNILPKSKFATLTFRPVDNDPRGTSVLRAAYNPWNEKQQLRVEYLKYLTQFASPSLIGYAAPLADPYPLVDATGAPLLNAFTGLPVMRTPEEDMIEALIAFANGTATAFPNGANVDAIEMSGEGAPFLDAFAYHDEQMTKAVLNQILATEEGKHQARAASATHKDVLDTMTKQAKRPVERMVFLLLKTWMRLNGHEKQLSLTPRPSLGTAEAEDIVGLRESVARLYSAGFLHDSQLPKLDEELKLPPRTVEETTIPVKETVTVQEQGGTVVPPGSGDVSTTPKVVTPPVAPTNGQTQPATNGKTPAA